MSSCKTKRYFKFNMSKTYLSILPTLHKLVFSHFLNDISTLQYFSLLLLIPGIYFLSKFVCSSFNIHPASDQFLTDLLIQISRFETAFFRQVIYRLFCCFCFFIYHSLANSEQSNWNHPFKSESNILLLFSFPAPSYRTSSQSLTLYDRHPNPAWCAPSHLSNFVSFYSPHLLSYVTTLTLAAFLLITQTSIFLTQDISTCIFLYEKDNFSPLLSYFLIFVPVPPNWQGIPWTPHKIIIILVQLSLH